MNAMTETITELEDIVLRASGLRKEYGPIVAVDHADFTLRKGEVHVLLGSNGCGKSTLCKMLSGNVAPTLGAISLLDKSVNFRRPAEASAAGIVTVFQEMSLVPTATVAQNIFLGIEPTRFGLVDRAAMRQATRRLFAEAGDLANGIDPDDLVGRLPVDKRQVVEILKGLARDPRIVFFDESTASLDKRQVVAFFSLVRRLSARGITTVFISHRMDEVFEIGNRVSVMRNGRCVATLDLALTNRDDLVQLMVGERRHHAHRQAHDSKEAPVVLAAEGLSGGKVRDVTFSLHEGEVLGLGGLQGQGQADLLLLLHGAIGRASGTVMLLGQPLRPSSPFAALRRGLALVSGDRNTLGAVLGRSIFENLALSSLMRGRQPHVRRSALHRRLEATIERLRLKYGRLADPIESLSGGNQQKVILGRALFAAPRVLLLDDPTRGIDVSAKRDVYALIEDLRRDGMAVILFSSEDPELLANADRILVFNSGRIVTELFGERMTEHDLNAAAFGTAATRGSHG